jgi:hypothetical protein
MKRDVDGKGRDWCKMNGACANTTIIPGVPPTTPAQEPVAWMYDWEIDGEVVRDWISGDYDEAHSPTMRCHNIRPLYTTPQPAPALLEAAEEVAPFVKRNERFSVAGQPRKTIEIAWEP